MRFVYIDLQPSLSHKHHFISVRSLYFSRLLATAISDMQLRLSHKVWRFLFWVVPTFGDFFRTVHALDERFEALGAMAPTARECVTGGSGVMPDVFLAQTSSR